MSIQFYILSYYSTFFFIQEALQKKLAPKLIQTLREYNDLKQKQKEVMKLNKQDQTCQTRCQVWSEAIQDLTEEIKEDEGTSVDPNLLVMVNSGSFDSVQKLFS